MSNIGDWVRAEAQARALNSISQSDVERISKAMADTGNHEAAANLQEWRQELGDPVTADRPFNLKMSPTTVLKLSDQWHERAAVAEADDVPFPDPWKTGGHVDGYQIEPITNAAELTRFAYRLHNCASTYARRIAGNRCFLYIVIEGETPVAMFQLVRDSRDDRYIQMGQLSGPCNEKAPDEIIYAVQKWWRSKCQNG